MDLPSQRIGLTVADCGFNIFMSDSDGSDLSKQFMEECAAIREDRSLWYKPIKFYIASGVLGMLHTEQVIVYVDAGTIFILSSLPSFEGADHTNVHEDSDGEHLVNRLFTGSQPKVSSLGIVPEGTDYLNYAKDYYTTNGLVTDGQINSEQAVMFLDQLDSVYHGNIFVAGGPLYSVYAVDAAVSSAIRYVRGDDSMQFIGREVLMIGGIPEIMPLGYHVNSIGQVFKVWTANDIDRFHHAKKIFDDEWLPHDIFDIDLDEMAEAYALHAERLRQLDPSEHLDELAGNGGESAPPVIDDTDGSYDHLVALGGVDSSAEATETPEPPSTQA